MRRNTLNFLVDAVTLLAIFAMVATGLVIRFVLPPGTGGRHGGGGLVLWGMGRHDWGDVHFWAAVVLAVLLVVHVALHWSWVCTTLRRSLGGKDAGQLSAAKRNTYGIGFFVVLVVILGGFVWYADTAVQETRSPESVEGRPRRSGADALDTRREDGHGIAHELIRGSMTLAEIEGATDVSVETLKTKLGLPGDISPQERLGRLSQQFGFSMTTVREIINKHQSGTQVAP